MKSQSRSWVVSRIAGFTSVCLLLVATPAPLSAGDEDAGGWGASLDLLASPSEEGAREAAFTVSRDGNKVTIHLAFRDRMITAELPAERAVFVSPLGDQTRLRDPWISLAELQARKPFANRGWSLWDGRPTPVHAAAAGIVLASRTDPVHGSIVEIGHGSGLRTRYLLGRYGTSPAAPGTRVYAGDAIGQLELGLPDDIPFVHFGVLLDAGRGQLVALDPAPLFFGSEANRARPLATSVLNAAVRAKDQAMVSRLLSLGVDPNGRAVDGTLPLEWAVLVRDPGMVRLLVAAGGDQNAKTAEHLGSFLEGTGPTIAHSGPTIAESVKESDDPELSAALTGQ